MAAEEGGGAEGAGEGAEAEEAEAAAVEVAEAAVVQVKLRTPLCQRARRRRKGKSEPLPLGRLMQAAAETLLLRITLVVGGRVACRTTTDHPIGADFLRRRNSGANNTTFARCTRLGWHG